MPINIHLYEAVVRLTNTSGMEGRCSLGSGVVFSPGGLIITNNHVVEDADFGMAFGEIVVESLKSVDRPASEAVPAEVVIRNEIYDLAILRITGAPPSHFIDLLKAPPTDASLIERRIRILGYPPLGGATITVTRGIVSGFDEAGNLKTDAEINPGNSGGAALDDRDTFLGIPSFIITSEQGKLGFVVSADRVKEWLGAVLKSGVPRETEHLDGAFTGPNLNVSGDNVDRSTRYPRILAKFGAVETLLSRLEYQKALPHIKFILEKRPRSALAYHYLGNALLGLGRYDEAAARYRASLAYDPRRIPALGNLGVALSHLGRHEEALQVFEEIIDATDDPAELWASYNNIGRIYEIRGQTTLAARYQEQAAALSAAAAERRADYTRKSQDKIAALADAIVNAEIEMEDNGRNST